MIEPDVPYATIGEIDPEFAHTALSARNTIWTIDELTDREKVLLCIGGDICSGATGLSLEMHLQLAVEKRLPFDAIREAARHLAPYCGYPTALTALARIAEIEKQMPGVRIPSERDDVQEDAGLEALKFLATIGGPLNSMMQRNWRRPNLSMKERALLSLLSDLVYQTLGISFNVHVDIALACGATRGQLDAAFRFMSGFGVSRAANAREALKARIM